MLEGFGGVGRGLGEGHLFIFAEAGGLLVQLLHFWRNCEELDQIRGAFMALD